MSDYVIGGWTQSLSELAPDTFSYVMYGMVTNLSNLTTGGGWGPASTDPPAAKGQVMWTYGGQGCNPTNMPTEDNTQSILEATKNKGWAGVDFDDECSMNLHELICTMKALQDEQKQTSYTFVAGYDYNHGGAANEAVEQIATAGVANRMVLLCYGAAMWTMQDIEANVGPAIERTINHGVPAKQVILALTYDGLDCEDGGNLDYFLDQVTSKDIGGLFIWEFPSLPEGCLEKIEKALGIA